MNIKSQLAPKGIEFKSDKMIVSNKHMCIMTIIDYPKMIYEGYLSQLTQMAGVKIVIKHIPVQFSILSKMLNKEIADLKARYNDERDRTMQEKLRIDYESIEEFINMLAASQARIFDFQMHVVVSADTQDELDKKRMQTKNYLDTMGMRGVVLRFEQEKVFKSILPLFAPSDIEERIGTPIPGPTIAAMYPFVFDSIKDPGLSCLLGVDFSGGVVLFNQFLYQFKKENNRNNANMIMLGTSGSGKSTAAKILLRTNIRNGHKIIAIDPEGELEDMTRLYGGDFIDLGRGGTFGMVNPLDVIVDADQEEIAQGLGYTILTKTLQSLKAFMKYYSPDITEDVLNLFSEIVQETYKRYKIDFDTDFTKFRSEDFPTFDDVYATIRGRLLSMNEKTHEKDVLERLEMKVRPFVKELRYYFTGKTTIEAKSDFIVFNIKELMNSDTNIRNALFFNVLKYAWGLCLDKSINTILFVDEAHTLLADKNTLGAEFLAQVQRRSRKYNTGTIIITQQPTDFASPEVIVHGKAIFDNAAYYLVMQLKKQATDDLSYLVDLNDQERESIKRYNQGEALFICGSRRMRINVIASQEELDSFGSGGGL
ncbi:VirB4 family type IV secretion system protein [Clostridium sp.]|uniref:VirB4 family type IV secretion system protein n=1 Tax=Clostridium sp. TaxID=1506 RepID=UPI002FC7AD72